MCSIINLGCSKGERTAWANRWQSAPGGNGHFLQEQTRSQVSSQKPGLSSAETDRLPRDRQGRGGDCLQSSHGSLCCPSDRKRLALGRSLLVRSRPLEGSCG